MTKFSRWFITMIFALIVGAPSFAQQASSNDLPDAPTPGVQPTTHERLKTFFSFDPSRSSAATKKNHHLFTAYNLSLGVLGASDIVDYLATRRFVGHVNWICLQTNTNGYAISTTDTTHLYTAGDIQSICDNPSAGLVANQMYDTRQNDTFSETDWVTQWGLVGKRNVAGDIGWNVAVDVGQILISQLLHRKGRWIGTSGTALNVAHSVFHFDHGIRLLHYTSEFGDANTYPPLLPQYDPYHSWGPPRWWGNK